MPLYEHVFLARQEVSPQQVEAMTKEFSEIIEQGGGKVGKTEYWGLKSLSFKIKKSRKAHYTLLNIDSPPDAIAEMERRMGLAGEVLRFMTIRVDKHETEPSVMMRKGDRDDRGDRGGFRGGSRGDRPPRGGSRDGGSTFRARPPADGASQKDGEQEPSRAPRPPRDATPKSEG